MPTYVNIGTIGTGSTSVTAGTPASLANGDGVILMVITKPDTATINTPSDWTLISDVAGGGGSAGNGTGPTRQAIFFREKDASWTTVPAVSITNGNSSAAIASRWTKTSGSQWDIAGATGVYGTSATTTDASTVLGSNPGLTAGDSIQIGFSNMDDAPTWSTYTISAPGVSAFTIVNERSDVIETTTGQDIGGAMATTNVTTGTATDAATVGATLSAAGRGTTTLTRIREVTPTAQSGSDTASLAIAETSSIAKVSTGAPTTNSGTGPRIANKPASVTTGTLMLAFHVVEDGTYAEMSAPAGWTLLPDASHDEGGSVGGHVKTYYRVADGSEGATFSFENNEVADASVSIIPIFGAGATPVFTIATDTNTGDDAPSVTPLTSDDLILAAAFASHNTSSSRIYTSPSGMEEIVDTGTTWVSQSVARKAPSGSTSATGTMSFTGNGATPRAGHQFQVSLVVSPDGTPTTTPKSASDTSSIAISDSSSKSVSSSPIFAASVTTNTTTVTVTRPDTVAGDRLIAFCWTGTTGATRSAPAADGGGTWVDITPANSISIGVFEMEANGSEPADFTFTRATATNNAAGVYVWNIGQYGPVDALSITNDTGLTVTIPGITVVDNNSFLGSVMTYAQTTAADTWTEPAGMTEVIDGPAPTNNVYGAAAYQIADAGATGDKDWVHTITATSHRGVLFAAGAPDEAETPINSSDTSSIAISESQESTSTLNGADTSSVAISDSSESALSSIRADTASLSITDTAATLVTVSVSDTSGLSIAETTDSARGITASDTGAVTITDAGGLSTDTTIPGSDSTAVSIAETTSTQSTGTASDTSALSITENATLNVTVSRTDTSSIGIGDASSSAVSVNRSDTSAVTITDVSSTNVSVSRTDTSVITITDASQTGVTVSVSDTSGITITDATTSARTIPASDTASITITDTSEILEDRTVTDDDTSGLSVDDDSTLSTDTGATSEDEVSVTITESIQLRKEISSNDPAALSITEATQSERTIVATDTGQVQFTELAGVSNDDGLVGQDSSAIGLVESTSTSGTNEAVDGISSIAITETATILVTLTRSDTAAITISDSSAQSIAKVATDTSSVAVTDSSSRVIVNFVTASDGGSLAIAETTSGLSTGTASESVSLGVAEIAAIYQNTNRSDTATVAITETATVSGVQERNDTTAITITESAVVSITIDRTDNLSLTVSDVSSSFRTVAVSDSITLNVAEASYFGNKVEAWAYDGQEWRIGQVLVYSEGEWKEGEIFYGQADQWGTRA